MLVNDTFPEAVNAAVETDVSPVNDVEVAPSATLVLPIVKLLLNRRLFPHLRLENNPYLNTSVYLKAKI